jgi:hypothetical protein
MIKATQPVTRFVGDGLASNFGPNEGNWSGGAKGDRALSPREWAIGWGTLLRAEGMSNGAGSEQLQEAEIAGPDDGLEVSDATRTADLACARAADRLLSRSASTQAAPNDPNVCDASAGHGRPGRRPCSAPRLPWITSGAAAGSDATSLKSPRSFDTPRRTSILTTRVSGMGISWEHAQDPQSVSGATGLGLGDMAAQMCPQPAQPEIKPIRDLNDLEQLAGSERGEGDCPGARVTALCSSRFEAPSYRLIRSAVSSEAKRTETHDPEISKDVETPGDTRGAVVAVEGTPVRQVDSESYGERRASPQIDLQSARISTPEVDALRSSSDKSDGARQLTQPLRVGDPHYSVNSVSGRHSSALSITHGDKRDSAPGVLSIASGVASGNSGVVNLPGHSVLTGGPPETRRDSGSPQAGSIREEMEHGSILSMNAPLTHLETRWLHTGAHRAEAGFEDPSVGWISVRAERDSNGVRAVLVAGSSNAEEVLNAHLGGLNAHLVSNHVALPPVTMSTEHGSRFESGFGGEAQQRNGGSERHADHEARSERVYRDGQADSTSGWFRAHHSVGAHTLLPLRTIDSGGIYVSLMA